MFFRYFLLLCVVASYAFAVQSSVEDTSDVQVIDVNIEERVNPAVKIVAKIISTLFTGAAISCVTEAATTCKQHWKNPPKALDCAKNFLKTNKGRCATGA